MAVITAQELQALGQPVTEVLSPRP